MMSRRGLYPGLLLVVVVLVALPLRAAAVTDPSYLRLAGTYLSHEGHNGPYMSLSLGADGTATLTEDPGTGTVVRFAHWSDPGSEVTIYFDPAEGKPAHTPMTFRVGHDELQATSWDHGFWGKTAPPVMKKNNGIKQTYWFTTVR